ncbi:MAG: hypothetical protein JJ896_07975 [Rhodothermales bacterium]|nr:hypothetical protein [Rhodothermales bacterium]MBO6779578.1 hypothetical protein [Rhodothermales bacterium]
MQQTLMAFLAMMVASIAAYNQQMSDIRSQEDRIRSEIEMMAAAVALHEMETAAASKSWVALDDLDDTTGSSTYDLDTVSVSFDWEWDVRYVDDLGELSVTPTDLKEAEITITHNRWAFDLVIIARTFGL